MIPRRSFVGCIGGLIAAPMVGGATSAVIDSSRNHLVVAGYQRAQALPSLAASTRSLGKWPVATAAELAVTNLESSRLRSWQVLGREPKGADAVQRIIEEEQYRVNFFGDATALDRLAQLSADIRNRQPLTAGMSLNAARIASMLHRFDEALVHLSNAQLLAAAPQDCQRVRLTVNQARGEDLPALLNARRQTADRTGAIQDLVPLAALLADMGEFDEADQSYRKAIWGYRNVSPFPLAWACFQLGVLWGETVPAPDPIRAAEFYWQAVQYLPMYTHARVHLAELHLDAGRLADAEALLVPVASSADPQVSWRLAQVLEAQTRSGEAAIQRDRARSAFDALIADHELAFADHAAEFYLSVGADADRAAQLARINLVNRPTLRAFELAHAAALASGSGSDACELRVRAQTKWSATKAYRHSPLAVQRASALVDDDI